MLAKVHRLALNRDFRLVFKKGRNFDTDVLRIKIAENQKNITRFGFVVSIKTARRAHDRNKIKRRLRNAVRFLLPSIRPGFDIVIWPKSQIKDSKYQDIVTSLQNLFKRSLLWQEK